MSQPDQDAIRAANADRERVVARLNDAFAEGRLEVGELEERVAAAYAAKTLGELRPLTADLPPVGAVQRSRSTPVPEPVAGRGVERRRERASGQAVAGLFGVFVLNVVIWGVVSAASGGIVYFWPVWILIPIAVAALRAFGAWSGRGDG